ncbi:MAG: rhodanese-like domain-containing protein [Candidatus Competibacterales bacterium]|nr:rhodanese-like domain-containing protein [Candidatus Competibacterales bacterium]
MPTSVSEMVSAANQSVPRIDLQRARNLIDDEEALVVDVRDPSEVQQSGKIRGAVNVSRGMLEFRADPECPAYDPAFDRDRPVLLYCGSGGRSALAGKVLQDMGYRTVYNLGAFKDWVEAGLETEPA